MATYDDLMVDIGNAPDDDQGDPLRTAFDKINQRFAELRVFLNNRGDWAPSTAYTANPNRDWVIVAGVGYLATSNHTSGATFAADLAAGKWVEADALALRAELAQPSGAQLVGGVDIQIADYTALRAYTGTKTRVYITGTMGTAKPEGIAGVFQHDPTDSASLDNGGTIIVGADGRRWKREFDDHINPIWFEAYPISERWADYDITPFLQKAIDAATGGVVRFMPGAYAMWGEVKIPSGTVIDFNGAKIIRKSNTNILFTNKTNGAGGYTAAKDITIKNGVIDANGVESSFSAGEFPTACTPIGFGHATNILVEDVEIYGVKSWHAIEINGCRKSMIRGCYIHDCDTESANAEAIQPDFMGSSGQFPWFGPYDDTPVDGLDIIDCHFERVTCAVGGHTAPAGNNQHQNIRISGCRFWNIYAVTQAIRTLNYSNVSITDNEFKNCLGGGVKSFASNATIFNVKIEGNRFESMGGTTTGVEGPSAHRAIHVGDPASTGDDHQNIIVANNLIKTVQRHAIGIDGVKYGVVSGNTVEDVAGVGIWVFQGEHVSVTGNTVQDCNKAGQRAAQIVLGDGGPASNIVAVGNSCGSIRAIGVTNGQVVSNSPRAELRIVAMLDYDGINQVVRSSFNVASVTKHATGDYTVNFASPIDGSYIAVAMGGTGSNAYHINQNVNRDKTASAFPLASRRWDNVVLDNGNINIAFIAL